MAAIISISTLIPLIREKWIFYLTSVSRRGLVNPSSPTFNNINFREWQIQLLFGNSIKNGCKYLYLHPKSFKITLTPNSYLMSIWRIVLVNASTHTFWNIDMTPAMVYWCSQKLLAFYENIIRNLERVFKLFWNKVSSLWGWFIWGFFQAIVWSIMKAGRSSLNILFQCVWQVGFEFNNFTLQYLL